MRTVFIQANDKQLLGAKLARYAIARKLRTPDSVRVEILNVDGALAQIASLTAV